MHSASDSEEGRWLLAARPEDGPRTGVFSLEEINRKLSDQLGLLQRITSRIPDTVFQYQRREDGSAWFPFISEAVRTMFRVSPEEARRDARYVFAAIHADDRQEFFVALGRTFRAGLSWTHEFRVMFADGTVRWLLGNAMTWKEADERLISYGAFTDITDRKEAEARLQESEIRFRSLTDLSSDWYWETDAQYRFTRFDGYRDGRSDLPQEYTLGKTRWELGSLNLSEEDWQAHRDVLAQRQMFKDFEIQRCASNGRSYWIAVSGMPMYDVRGEFRGYRGIGRDITTRKQAEYETLRLAFYDTLTGLPNRRLLMDRLTHTLAMSERRRRYGAVLFIDLDNFKDLNDTQGHDVGDQLLQQVAKRLAACLREGDTAARFGGDEFVVMFDDLGENANDAANQVEVTAKKIMSQLNQPYMLQDKQYSSTPSIGIALFCGSDHAADELLKRADVAMYQAKAAGRNTLQFFDPEMQATVMARASLNAELHQGMLRDEFMLHYQPLVDQDGKITGYEALLRWKNPARGLVLPDQFIVLAEQTGLILSMGRWVMQAACRELVQWARLPEMRELTLSVNVSARQFRQPEFVAEVLTILSDSGANAERLKLELTESVLLGDVADAIRKMGLLRSRGVRFALDDFGTGYSSLSYLKRLPLDQLKIDKSFVRDVLEDPNDAAIVRTILALAQSLDLVAVAEGVETTEQHQFLLLHGCRAFQGYLFGHPRPLPDAAPST